MRRSPFRVYAPLLVFVVVQALFVAFAPSRPPTQIEIGAPPVVDGTGDAGTTTGGGAGGSGGAATGTATGNSGEPLTSGGTTGTAGAPPSAGGTGGTTTGTGAATTGGTVGSTGSTGATTGGATTGGTTGAAAGDTSHCTGDGFQTPLLYFSPPCAPKWEGGDNGGSTYPGVTAETVKVVVFQEERNAAVSQILAAEGLRESRENEDVFTQVSEDFLNEHFEFYGREIDLVPFPAPACPESPPDDAGCIAEVQRMIEQERPFAVIWQVPTYAAVFDVLAANQIISLGGWHHDASYFSGRRPFRYDLFMDGTQTAEFVGEYYCKKMANQNATHTGQVIHDTIGLRGQVPRRVGILAPDTPATKRPADRLAEIIRACDAQDPIVITYDQNITTSTQQASANTQTFIAEKVTTMICMCDPISPFFRFENQSRNRYFPENLLAGSGLIDFDKITRLYDPRQRAHMFGPSHLQIQDAQNETDATVVWQDQGMSGNACVSCRLPWGYYQLIGTMIQIAGPDLNPLSVERGLLNLPDRGGWVETGGDPTKVLIRFGPGDYTGTSDVKTVYWDEQATSTVDGRPGAYVALDGGFRWTLGTFDTVLRVPAAPS